VLHHPGIVLVAQPPSAPDPFASRYLADPSGHMLALIIIEKGDKNEVCCIGGYEGRYSLHCHGMVLLFSSSSDAVVLVVAYLAPCKDRDSPVASAGPAETG
jgi:hypothetical protein